MQVDSIVINQKNQIPNNDLSFLEVDQNEKKFFTESKSDLTKNNLYANYNSTSNATSKKIHEEKNTNFQNVEFRTLLSTIQENHYFELHTSKAFWWLVTFTIVCILCEIYIARQSQGEIHENQINIYSILN